MDEVGALIVPPEGILVPTKATLTKYGLDEQQWLTILRDQGWVCPICHKVPSTGRFVVDHFHVRGYKKLPADQKRLYVRGITCWWDNHAFIGRGITLEIAKNVVKYLAAFEKRRPKK